MSIIENLPSLEEQLGRIQNPEYREAIAGLVLDTRRKLSTLPRRQWVEQTYSETMEQLRALASGVFWENERAMTDSVMRATDVITGIYTIGLPDLPPKQYS